MIQLNDAKYYEDGIINAVLSFPEDHPKIFNKLTANHFIGSNQKIFKVLKSLYDENKPNSLSNESIVSEICTVLRDQRQGWSFWTKHFTSEAPLPADTDFYIKRIIQHHNRRRLLEISNATQKRIQDGESSEEVCNFTIKQIDSLDSEAAGDDPVNFNDVAIDCIDQLQSGDLETLTGIKTGYVDIDSKILGMRPGDLVVIAGRPGMGKTTLATNISANAARQGYVGLIFSMEMSKYRLGLRMLAAETNSNLYNLSKGIVNDWNKINQVPQQMQNLYIDFLSGLNHTDVVSRINQFTDTHRIDFVVLDYLQKLKFARGERHDIEVGKATWAFKNVAKDLNIPFILLSQLSRANEKTGGKIRKPQMSDLKDSGSIEQDADIVMLIHRPEAYQPDNVEYRNLAQVGLAKNRDGEIGGVNLTFRKEINRFENYKGPRP